MKLNVYWIMLVIFVCGMFLVFAVDSADSDTIYYESSKNYNGYLPLPLEDYLISIGLVYSEQVYYYGYDIDTLYLDENDYYWFINVCVYDYEYNYSDNPYTIYCNVNITLNYSQGWIINIYMPYDNVNKVVTDYIYGYMIVGYSNYEVTP